MSRKIAASLSLCGLVVGGVGCISSDAVHNIYPHASSETMTESGKDHYHRVQQVMLNDKKSLTEDLDVFFLTERPSRLNRWHSK